MNLKHAKKILSSAALPAILLLFLAGSYFRVMDDYELQTLDYRFLLRPAAPVTDDVVLIEIGNDTIERLGRFPFDREYHTMIVKALSEAGAKAILFDIFFSEPDEDDEGFQRAIKDAGCVYLPVVFDIDPSRRSNQTIARGYIAWTIDNLDDVAKGSGHINISPDQDGKFRRLPLYVKYGKADWPYVSFRMVIDYLGIHDEDVKFSPGKSIRLGNDILIPLDERSNIIINFSGKWASTYKHYSYVDIVQAYLASISGDKPRMNLNVFKGKICIIGLTAAGTVDLHPNPLETLYPGLGIHAEIINSILNKNFIRRASRPENLAILVFICVLVSLFTMKLRPIKGLSFLIAVISAFVLVAILIFNFRGIWIDLFFPVVAMISAYLILTLRRYVAEWRKRIVLENELDIAKKIQESFLPKILPSTGGVEIAAAMFTARQVGGDLYDFIEPGEGRLGIMIGDVSGKGIPASLFMAMAMGEFKTFANQDFSPHEVLFRLNDRLLKESSMNLFVTMFYLMLDFKKMTFEFSNGGHLPVIHAGNKNTVELLDTEEGSPLGMIESSYISKNRPMSKGDVFIFYTDGVTEAMNSKGEMYGADRFISVIRLRKDAPAKILLAEIEKDIRKFEPAAKQHDDITIMVVKI